jgi:hypothetical protein
MVDGKLFLVNQKFYIKIQGFSVLDVSREPGDAVMDLHSSLTSERAQHNDTGRMEEEGITILTGETTIS